MQSRKRQGVDYKRRGIDEVSPPIVTISHAILFPILYPISRLLPKVPNTGGYRRTFQMKLYGVGIWLETILRRMRPPILDWILYGQNNSVWEVRFDSELSTPNKQMTHNKLQTSYQYRREGTQHLCNTTNYNTRLRNISKKSTRYKPNIFLASEYSDGYEECVMRMNVWYEQRETQTWHTGMNYGVRKRVKRWNTWYDDALRRIPHQNWSRKDMFNIRCFPATILLSWASLSDWSIWW